MSRIVFVCSLALLACALMLGCSARPSERSTRADPGLQEAALHERARFIDRLLDETEALQRAGEPESARAIAERARDEAVEIGDARRIAASEAVLGHVLIVVGEESGARAALDRAIDASQREGLANVEAAARLNRGNLMRMTGEYEAALGDYATSERLASASADRERVVSARVSALRAFSAWAAEQSEFEPVRERGRALAKDLPGMIQDAGSTEQRAR